MSEDKQYLSERIAELTGWSINPRRMEIVKDTSDWMRIKRGDIIRVGGRDYVVRGNMREPRFGIDDQPKLWVFSAIDIDSGAEKIIKTEFEEEFYAHISIFKIRCYRSPEKEGEVLKAMRGDMRFMQGEYYYDERGNNVRVIDYIKGRNFFHEIPNIAKGHREYFAEDLPGVLWKLREAFEAIKDLHDLGICHGDIRNDHIIIDGSSGDYRWIDFDLKQDVQDFDMWSMGNILSYAVAKGILTFKALMQNGEIGDEVKRSLTADDGSAFYNYRVMNLGKVYDYIPESLSRMLRHFTMKPEAFYRDVREFYEDYVEMLEKEFPRKA